MPAVRISEAYLAQSFLRLRKEDQRNRKRPQYHYNRLPQETHPNMPSLCYPSTNTDTQKVNQNHYIPTHKLTIFAIFERPLWVDSRL
jgi:hypothetical protein